MSSTLERPSEPELRLQPLKILVVDDDAQVAAAVCAALEMDGHSVTTACGGRPGIDALLLALGQGRPFAALITDLGMPYVDGLQLSAEARQADPSIMVILLTGWGHRLLADGALPPHVDAVLCKPPERNTLQAALARCLAARRNLSLA